MVVLIALTYGVCVYRNFLGVGVSVREGYWRIGVRGLEGVCHQVGGANFTGMTQIKKTEMMNALKVTSLSLSLHFEFLYLDTKLLLLSLNSPLPSHFFVAVYKAKKNGHLFLQRKCGSF